MQFEQFVASINTEMYDSMKHAVEIGRWPDGRTLSQAERDLSLRAIIAYDFKHKPAAERVGYIEAQCQSAGQAKKP